MSTVMVHFLMKMFGIADRSVNGRIEGQKVQNSRLDSYQWKTNGSGMLLRRLRRQGIGEKRGHDSRRQI